MRTRTRVIGNAVWGVYRVDGDENEIEWMIGHIREEGAAWVALCQNGTPSRTFDNNEDAVRHIVAGALDR